LSEYNNIALLGANNWRFMPPPTPSRPQPQALTGEAAFSKSLNQVYVTLRRFDTAGRLLLKAVQHVHRTKSVTQLHGAQCIAKVVNHIDRLHQEVFLGGADPVKRFSACDTDIAELFRIRYFCKSVAKPASSFAALSASTTTRPQYKAPRTT
jgi:hypothetical protein